MGRPKQNADFPSAKERLEDAFWSLLAEGDYYNITISTLARQANVNHNTIYYHYKNIDAMAVQFFQENIPTEILQAVLMVSASDDFEPERLFQLPEVRLKWQRMRLFARGDSAFLMSCFKESIRESWLSAMHLTVDELSGEKQLQLDFLTGGMLSIVGSENINSPEELFPFLKSSLGQCVLSTLNNLSK